MKGPFRLPGAAALNLQCLGLVLIVVAAYYPSLFQPARADQFVYLYTTKDKTDLFALTLGSYSWNRDMGGDIHFFRPLLVCVLGLERWAFGGDRFFAWQLVSLLLHLTVVLLLFRWLRGRRGGAGPLPFVVTAFFGVQYASMELVVWHHLAGYLLFSVLLVGVFCALDRCTPGASPAWQALLVLLVLLAAFTLEPGNILAVLVAGYMLCVLVREYGRGLPPMARTFRPLTLAATLAVPVLYTAANFADQYYRYGRLLAGPAHEGCLSPWAGLEGMVSAGGLWLLGGFLPDKVDLGVGSRMGIVAIHPSFSRELFLQGAAAAAALLAFLVLAVQAVRLGGRLGRLPVGLVALLFALAYAALLVFLRAGPRGLTSALAENSYYAYIFNLALLIFLPTLAGVGAGPVGAWAGPGRLPRAVLGAALAVLALAGAGRIYTQGKAQAHWGRGVTLLAEQVRRLRAAHGGDDFTFCVAPDHPGEEELPYVGRDGADGHPLTVSHVLFPRYYSGSRPRYVVCKPYRGFDVLQFDGAVWAFPPKHWPDSLSQLHPRRDPRWITAETEAEVEQAIDRRRAALAHSPRHGRE
jgi:hypothetical protein